ncbi:MAG: site-specific DNA recombinase [Clostridium sp.]|jgi:site-specific DNA recombinase
MQFITKNNGTVCVKKCQHTDPYGNECTNRGGTSNYILDAINQKLLEFEDKIILEINNVPDAEIASLKNQIEIWKKELCKKEKAFERIQEAYENGDYELDTYRKRKEKVNKETNEIKKELYILDKQLSNNETVSNVDKLNAIKEFNKNLSKNCSPSDLNRLYKTLIDSIIWTRVGDTININVNFL